MRGRDRSVKLILSSKPVEPVPVQPVPSSAKISMCFSTGPAPAKPVWVPGPAEVAKEIGQEGAAADWRGSARDQLIPIGSPRS